MPKPSAEFLLVELSKEARLKCTEYSDRPRRALRDDTIHVVLGLLTAASLQIYLPIAIVVLMIYLVYQLAEFDLEHDTVIFDAAVFGVAILVGSVITSSWLHFPIPAQFQ